MDAFTAKEYAAFHLKVLDEHLPLAADILGDIVLNPLFDPDEMTKEKKVIFEEINMVEDTPGRPGDRALHRGLLAGPPAGPSDPRHQAQRRPASGAQELASFFRAVYRPGQHPDLGRRPPRARGRVGAGAPPFRGPRAGWPDAHRLAAPARRPHRDALQEGAGAGPHVPGDAAPIRQTHQDRYGTYILNTVLGGSMSSRLFQNIREKRGPRVLDLVGRHRLFRRGRADGLRRAPASTPWTRSCA